MNLMPAIMLHHRNGSLVNLGDGLIISMAISELSRTNTWMCTLNGRHIERNWLRNAVGH
jgi:hypothetical protein